MRVFEKDIILRCFEESIRETLLSDYETEKVSDLLKDVVNVENMFQFYRLKFSNVQNIKT